MDEHACKFSKIPHEIVAEILKYLNDEDALALSFTCQKMLDTVTQERKLTLKWNRKYLLEELIRWNETMKAVTEIYYFDNEYCDIKEMMECYRSPKDEYKHLYPPIANTYQKNKIGAQGIAIELCNSIELKNRRNQIDIHESKPDFLGDDDCDKIEGIRKTWLDYSYYRSEHQITSEDSVFKGFNNSGFFNSGFASDKQIKYAIDAFPSVQDITLVQKNEKDAIYKLAHVNCQSGQGDYEMNVLIDILSYDDMWRIDDMVTTLAQNCKNIQNLDIPVPCKSMKKFVTNLNSQLKNLTLSYYLLPAHGSTSNESLKVLALKCPDLDTLTLDVQNIRRVKEYHGKSVKSVKFVSPGLNYILTTINLTSLTLEYFIFYEDDITRLFKHSSNLKKLILKWPRFKGAKKLNKGFLDPIASCCNTLECFQIVHCSQLNDGIWNSFLPKIGRRLKHLVVDGCYVSKDVVLNISSYCKMLEVLSISSSHRTWDHDAETWPDQMRLNYKLDEDTIQLLQSQIPTVYIQKQWQRKYHDC